jgi:predicted acetyltransferase
MGMELRDLEPGDALAHRRLMSHAFGQGRIPDEPKEGDDPPKGVIGLFEGTALRASLGVNDFSIVWGAAGPRSMGGVAGVATWAEARGRGLVDRLLKESLVRMRDSGQSLSALYPFAWAFYRKFGWEWVGERATVTLPLRELPRSRADVRRIESEDDARTLVRSVYERYTATHHGPLTAQSRDWNSRLSHSDNKQTYVYAAGDDGYLLWRYNADDAPGDIREMLAVTPEAQSALLGLLRDLGVQRKTATWSNAPSDQTLLCHLAHWDVKQTVEPVFAARVVDVAQALSGLPASVEGRVCFSVTDEAAPWNAGVFTLEASGGKTVCTRSTSAPQLALDIQALSQAVWGHPSLAVLRRAGRTQVSDDAGFRLLADVLPPATVWHPNFF